MDIHNSNDADAKSTEGTKASIIAGYDRREQDWALQSNLANKEINQINKQIVAAQIREYITEKEWKNHQKQIENAQDIEAFLEGEKVDNHKKTSTKGFYTYLKRESRGLYNQYFQLAYDISKKAERALQQELGDQSLSILKYDYLSGKEGLYAGEKLNLDLQRMEMMYHDLNVRELELIKHISLKQLSPIELIKLKTTGVCTIVLPEELFDLGGCEGHYFRRIRSVSISIPCITGPYASVNCTLTLTKSTIRTSSALLDGAYERQDGESERFSDNYSSLQSIVTSTAQSDAGLFDPSLNGERKLPFEYAGAVSEWVLELPDPKDGFPLFDYNSITDVIMHVQYTARQGGGLLKNGALENINTFLNVLGSTRLFSMRHEFPNEWHRFKSQDTDDNRASLKFKLEELHYPFWSKNRIDEIEKIEVIALTKDGAQVNVFDALEQGNNFSLANDPAYGDVMVAGLWENFDLPNVFGDVELFFEDNSIEDLFLAVNWKTS